MTKASKKLADLLAKQEETARQIAEIQKQAATEIGQIAVGAGIHTLDLTKKQLEEVFSEVAARFSKGQEQSDKASSQGS
ncbi:MAG: TraC family protein [Parvibaculaceae bacterium]